MNRTMVRWLFVVSTHQNEQRILNLIYLPQSRRVRANRMAAEALANRANKRLHKRRHLGQAMRNGTGRMRWH